MKRGGAKKNLGDYTYLADLDDHDSSHYYLDRREYLRDLPVRPTKRKRDGGASATTTAATLKWSYRDDASSSLRDHRTSSSAMDWTDHRFNSIAVCFSTLASLAVGALAIYFQRQRVRRTTMKSQTAARDVPAAVTNFNEHLPQKKKEDGNQENPPEERNGNNPQIHRFNEDAESSETIADDVQTSQISKRYISDCEIETKSVNVDDGGISQSGVLVSSIPTSCDVTAADPARAEVDSTTNVYTPRIFGITNYSFEQNASRLESKGLDRQKSLELAAQFEMNHFFFEQTARLLSVASSQFLDQIQIFSSNALRQLDSNHREIMDVSEMEQLRKYREQISFLNPKVAFRSFLLAFASRYSPYLRYAPTFVSSPMSIVSALISSYCPECNASFSDQSSLAAATSYFMPYFVPDYWLDLVCLMPCMTRMCFYIICLGACHRFISEILCYAILVMILCPWRALLVTLGAVLAAYISLTLWVLWKCEKVETTAREFCQRSRTSDAGKRIIKHYVWIIPRYKTGVYASAVIIGFYQSFYVK